MVFNRGNELYYGLVVIITSIIVLDNDVSALGHIPILINGIANKHGHEPWYCSP